MNKVGCFFLCSGVHNDVKWSNLHPVNLVKQLRTYGANFPIDTVLEMMKRVNNPLNHLKYYISEPPLWSYFLIKPSDQKGGYFSAWQVIFDIFIKYCNHYITDLFGPFL